jgi:hypothetical protein
LALALIKPPLAAQVQPQQQQHEQQHFDSHFFPHLPPKILPSDFLMPGNLHIVPSAPAPRAPAAEKGDMHKVVLEPTGML